MVSEMNDDYLLQVVNDLGYEQILVDAELTIEDVMLLLNELKYIDLEMYCE
jgi:hypothetical protein